MTAIHLMSSKENIEEILMHSKSDNIEIVNNDKADEVIVERFQSLLSCAFSNQLRNNDER